MPTNGLAGSAAASVLSRWRNSLSATPPAFKELAAEPGREGTDGLNCPLSEAATGASGASEDSSARLLIGWAEDVSSGSTPLTALSSFNIRSIVSSDSLKRFKRIEISTRRTSTGD
jgi:hypothetical protein